MIDWPLAQRIAGSIGGAPGTASIDQRELQALADESLEAVVGYAKLAPREPIPLAESVTRQEWSRANTRSLSALLDPAVEEMGRRAGKAGLGLELAASAALTLEAGTVLGLLSRRVLGQYDIALVEAPDDPPPRLLFVSGNLGEAATSFGADAGDFLRWVVLHEVTHAAQFGAVDWLRPYLGSNASKLVESFEPTGVAAARRPLGDIGTAVVERVSRSVAYRDPFALMLDPDQRALLDRLQAAMTIVEGHAEHVMDAAGAQSIQSLARLRRVMGERRRSPGPLWKVVSRLLGMEMKLRQYEAGRRFCDEVVREGGIDTLNLVWGSPDALPSQAEIAIPAQWLKRI